MPTIHFNTAKAITGLSRASLWRRISTHPGSSETLGEAKGRMHTRIDIDSALAWGKLGLTEQDRALILGADADHAGAQHGLGLRLLELGHPQSAMNWLEQAAKQGHAQAMERLAECLVHQRGGEQDETESPEDGDQVTITLHPEHEADLQAWVKGMPTEDLAVHIKQALREYIARYAGQTVMLPVGMRRMTVPAVPEEALVAPRRED